MAQRAASFTALLEKYFEPKAISIQQTKQKEEFCLENVLNTV